MSRNAWMHFYVVKKNCDPVTDAHTLQSNKAPYNT